MAKRGRPPLATPGPDSYSSDKYGSFLTRIDTNSIDLNEAQADRRELMNAEAQQGLNRKAHAFVQSLRTAVRNDKMTLQDALATLDCVAVYAEWGGLYKQADFFRDAGDAALPDFGDGGNGAGKQTVTKGDARGAFKSARRRETDAGGELPPAA